MECDAPARPLLPSVRHMDMGQVTTPKLSHCVRHNTTSTMACQCFANKFCTICKNFLANLRNACYSTLAKREEVIRMASLSLILKQRRKDLGLTLAQIADLMEVTEATVQRWESGNIKTIRHEKIRRLADVLKVTPAALMGWEDTSTAKLPGSIIPIPAMHKIPLMGTIACGTPVLAAENIEDEVETPEHIHADFALRCKGDSMINARIFNGDIVYIRQQDTVENGEIAAVLIEDEATLKRVRLFDDHISLEPENPQYRPMVLWGEEMNAVRILGKAVAFTSIIL